MSEYKNKITISYWAEEDGQRARSHQGRDVIASAEAEIQSVGRPDPQGRRNTNDAAILRAAKIAAKTAVEAILDAASIGAIGPYEPSEEEGDRYRREHTAHIARIVADHCSRIAADSRPSRP